MKVTKTNRKGRGAKKRRKLSLPLLPSYFLSFLCPKPLLLFIVHVLGLETTAMEAKQKCGFWKTSKC